MAGLNAVVVPVTPFQQNCLLAWDGATKRGAVVDPGGDVDRILAAIAETGARPDRILLTHGHLDHAGGAAELQAALLDMAGSRDHAFCPIIGPDRRDEFLLEEIEAQALAYQLTGMRDARPDQWLSEGDTVTIGNYPLRVLHCPGHTPGHVVFVSDAARFAIVGDVLFQGSVGRTDFPYGDPAALIASIREKLLPLGDDIEFVCGHGPGSTLGAERRSNPFLRP